MPYDIYAKDVVNALQKAVDSLVRSNTDFRRGLALGRLIELQNIIENSESGVISFPINDPSLQTLTKLSQQLQGFLSKELANNPDAREFVTSMQFGVSQQTKQRPPVMYEQLLPNKKPIENQPIMYGKMPQSETASIVKALQNAQSKYIVYESLNDYLDTKAKNPQAFKAEEDDPLRTNKIIYKKNNDVFLIHRDPEKPGQKVEPLKLALKNNMVVVETGANPSPRLDHYLNNLSQELKFKAEMNLHLKAQVHTKPETVLPEPLAPRKLQYVELPRERNYVKLEPELIDAHLIKEGFTFQTIQSKDELKNFPTRCAGYIDDKNNNRHHFIAYSLPNGSTKIQEVFMKNDELMLKSSWPFGKDVPLNDAMKQNDMAVKHYQLQHKHIKLELSNQFNKLNGVEHAIEIMNNSITNLRKDNYNEKDIQKYYIEPSLKQLKGKLEPDKISAVELSLKSPEPTNGPQAK